jgi:hypothetical protein
MRKQIEQSLEFTTVDGDGLFPGVTPEDFVSLAYDLPR